MKIEKTEHYTTIECMNGSVTVCNELSGEYITKQLSIINEHDDECYIDLREEELDALISALQLAKSHYQS